MLVRQNAILKSENDILRGVNAGSPKAKEIHGFCMEHSRFIGSITDIHHPQHLFAKKVIMNGSRECKSSVKIAYQQG